MSDVQWRRLQDSYIERYHRLWEEKGSNKEPSRQKNIAWHRDFFFDFCRLEGDVVDLGCGATYTKMAKYGSPLSALPMRYFGTDPERMWHDGTYPFVQCMGESLPFPSGTFDHAICCSVLDHALNPSALINEADRVLRPGGALHIALLIHKQHREEKSVPPRRSWFRLWRGRQPQEQHQTHMHPMTRDQLLEMLKPSFTLEDERRLPWDKHDAEYLLFVSGRKHS